MKITDALKEASKTQDKARMVRLFNQMERKGMDFTATPLICAVNLVGLKAHRFAWDCLEDWQNS